MAQRGRTMTLRIVGELEDANKSLKQMDSKLSKFGAIASKAVGAVGVAIAGSQVVEFMGAAVDKASDLNESMNKVETVFGDSADAMTDFIKSADKIGLSDRQAAEYAGSLGNMFDQLKIADDEAAKLSETTLTLAADLGSFNNLDTADVLDRINSALRGEYDSIQAVIPTINAAVVAQEALAMTGKQTTEELTAQDKALATLAILNRDAGAAAGDFARTSDSLANRQKILSARWDDMQTQLGTKLLPVMNALVGFLLDKVIPAIGKVVAWVQTNWPKIQAAIEPVIANIVSIVQSAVALITAIWERFGTHITNYLRGVFTVFSNYLQGMWKIFSGVIQLIAAVLRGDWSAMWDAAKQIVSGFVQQIRGLITGIPQILWGILGAIGAAASELAGAIWRPFRDTINRVIGGWNGLEFTLPKVDTPLGDFGGWTVGTPNIPKLASGGIVRRPTVAMLGEAGPEAVIPLDRARGAVVVNLHIGVLGDPVEAGRIIANALDAYTGAYGRTAIRTLA